MTVDLANTSVDEPRRGVQNDVGTAVSHTDASHVANVTVSRPVFGSLRLVLGDRDASR